MNYTFRKVNTNTKILANIEKIHINNRDLYTHLGSDASEFILIISITQTGAQTEGNLHRKNKLIFNCAL